MNMRLAVLTVACALFALGTAIAADQPESNAAAGHGARAQSADNPVIGLGSGTGMGPGGSAGSASSLGGGMGSPDNGRGMNSFGGGFDQQQAPGSGPLSVGGAENAGSAGNAMRR